MSIILKSEKIIEALIEQVAHELGSHILYRNLSSLCKNKGWLNSQSWFTNQYKEELEHYNKILDFIDDAGYQGFVDVGRLKDQPVEYNSLSDIYKAALKREQETTESISKIVELCIEEKDFIAEKFAKDLLYIQLQEEDEANDRYLTTQNSNDNLIIDQYIGELK